MCEGTLKQPTTFEQQIAILRNRGMVIEDEKAALAVLKRINYYRLSAYMLSLKENDRFFDGVTFNDVYNLYEFDKRLRNLLLGMLESIEISFRTHISYIHAHKYGPLGYLNPDNFFNADYHNLFIEDLERELGRRSDELFIIHHKSKYNGKFPVWVAVEVLSFGSLSKFYSNMKNEDKASVAKEFYKVPYKYLVNWLFALSHIRNICAHYGRLYDRILKFPPRLDEKDKKHGFVLDRIFSLIFIMKKLCPNPEAWVGFVESLGAIIEKYENIDLERIGFPKDWQKIIR